MGLNYPYVRLNWRKFIYGLFASLIITVCITPLTYADTNNPDGSFNFVVTPIPMVLEAKPGTQISNSFKVKNAGLSTEHVKISVMKFTAQGENGTPKLQDITPSDDYAKWISFSQTRFDAAPNVWVTIGMTINVPKSAAYGYYYAVIFSRDGASPQNSNHQSNLQGAVAGLVLLDVQAPGANREAKLVEFSSPKKIYEFLPANFTVRMQNIGNVHVAPRGNIFITKGGKNVGLLEVNLSEGYILPGTYRTFSASWNNGWPAYQQKVAAGKAVVNEQGKHESSLDWSNFNPSKLRFGRYTAHLVMVYNDGSRDVPVEASLSFWVIPWRILAVIAVAAILIVAGLFPTIILPLKRRLQKRKSSYGTRSSGR